MFDFFRFAYTSQQVRNKPGREVVTFLLGKVVLNSFFNDYS